MSVTQATRLSPSVKPRCGRVPLSPLRYPGGKTRFVPHLVRGLEGRAFARVVEPFCGGASVSLGLLAANIVETAVISDADPLIAAFWTVATEHTIDLIELMDQEPVTVERWQHWKSVDETMLDTLHQGLKALYLNRTTFSGLIRFGSVLGGLEQSGTTKVGDRFNKDALAACLLRIGKWHTDGRLVALHRDYREALADAAADDLVYLDPPYVEKADALYGMSFGEQDHRDLAAAVRGVRGPVMVAYDDHPLIRELYSGSGLRFDTPTWSYGMGSIKRSRELLITNVDL